MSDFEGLQDEPAIRERLPSDPPPPQTLEAAFGSEQPTLEELQDAAAEALCARAQEVSERYPDKFDGRFFADMHYETGNAYATAAADIQTLLQYAGMVTQINEGLMARVEELEAELAQISRSQNP